jgi:hypothetical protein
VPFKTGAVIGRNDDIPLEVNVAQAIDARLRASDGGLLQYEAILKNISQ